jgi:calcineurin-like phosphoesterase family protein
MSELWTTADLHFDHKLMLDPERMRTPRPYSTVEEMNEGIVETHNRHVSRGDRVYIVGDVTFSRDTEKVRKLLQGMHGQKYLILGNHDERNGIEKLADCFVWIKERFHLKVPDPDAILSGGKQILVFDHYPALSWRHSGKGSWLIHGHCHGNLERAAAQDGETVRHCWQILNRTVKRTLEQELVFTRRDDLAAAIEYLSPEMERISRYLEKMANLHIVDVGWDVWHRPLPYEKLKSHFRSLEHLALDHHSEGK